MTKLSYSLPTRLVDRVKGLSAAHQITATEVLRMVIEIGLPEVEKAFHTERERQNELLPK